MFRKITVAFDESEEAGRALQAAVELAKSLDASLNVISVIEPPPIYFSFSTLVAPYIRWTDEMETRYTNLQSCHRYAKTHLDDWAYRAQPCGGRSLCAARNPVNSGCLRFLSEESGGA